jgi:hypothetical protein
MLQIPEQAKSLGSIWTRLLRSATVLRHPGGSGQRGRWIEKVEQVIADLEDLNRSTERDFLAIGGKLMDFLSTAQRISSDMTAVADLIAGEQGERASQALADVLEGARQMQSRAEQRDEALGILSNSARSISSTFARFLDTVSTFRALGTLVRIETARLGTTGVDLEHVAAEVKLLI